MNVLWVEDEKHLLAEGAAYLRGEGFTVREAASASDTLQCLAEHPTDLVLLDWMLPDMSGLELCRQIRQTYALPVIMVTAKTDEFDKVLALEIGADDYIVKPFGMREVAARIRAVARRSVREQQTAASSGADVWVRGDLRIEPLQHAVFLEGRPLALTPTEFALLCTLANHPGRVYSRSQLMDEAMGEQFVVFERTIDSHIRNLRRKLGDSPDDPKYIVTVFGIGYKFGVGANG